MALSVVRQKRRVSTDVEQRVLIGMIVSDQFCKEIIPILKLDFFKNEYIKKVASWITHYHKRYEQAPKKQIQTLYDDFSHELNEDESELVEDILERASKEYAQNTENFNAKYLVDIAKPYFHERNVEILRERLTELTRSGRYEEAEDAIKNYKEVAQQQSVWSSPLDSEEEIKKTFESDKSSSLFSFDGLLGQICGEFKRGWFISWQGGYKFGKTWWLIETAMSAIENGLKVAFISLEMSRDDIHQRFYQRIIPSCEEEGQYWVPVFDCKKNLLNNCDEPAKPRQEKVAVSDSGVDYEAYPDHRICNACRGNKKFEPFPWLRKVHREQASYSTFKRLPEMVELMFGRDLLRVASYPRFSASMKDIENDLDILEWTEDFTPDVIIIDYADIIAPSDTRLTGRDRHDETWKMLGGLAGKKSASLFTATQGTREVLESYAQRQTHTSEDIRKLGHVDIKLGINQVDSEKDMKVQRINILVHRHRKFNINDHVLVAQDLEAGQPYLDGELIKVSSGKKKKKNQEQQESS